jgi:glycosyltransferase involved in cell wall biosynthesis
MRFSIVICSWNSEPYIAQTIASVLAQTHPSIELVFVDGGSTDGTLERIKAVERPKRVLEGVRGGVGRAMNEGLRAATGDVVAHLHADDYYLHERVLEEAAEVFARTGAQWAFGRAMSDMNDGRLLPEGWQVPRYSYAKLLHSNFIPHQATFVRRSLFEQAGGFDTAYRFAMDYDLWLRLAKLAEPAQVDKHWVAFRRHAGSLTTANYLKSMREDFAVRMKNAGWSPSSVLNHGARFAWRQVRFRTRQARASLGG